MNKIEKKIKEIQDLKRLDTWENEINRARSITVGTAFGGMTELGMRGDGMKHMWVILNSPETIELIHQLAAGIGCHINIVPRNDFASHRTWREDPDKNAHLVGYNSKESISLLPDNQKNKASTLLDNQKQVKSNNRSKKNEPLAIKDPVNKQPVKRTTKIT